MTLEELLKELRARGLELASAGGELRVRGPKARLDPDFLSALRTHKPQLLARLQALARDAFPLTEVQHAYWLGRSGAFEIGNVSAHVYHEIEARGLDAGRLAEALRRVVQRHPALRTRVEAEGVQREIGYEAVVPPQVPVHDLSRADESSLQAALCALRSEMSHQVMPAERVPLVDARLVLLPGGRQRLFVGHDGLAIDGISMLILFADWFEFYADPAAPLRPPEVTFREHLRALEDLRRGPVRESSRAYWLGRIDGGLPAHPQLPLRCEPAGLRQPRFARREVRLDAARCAAFTTHARALGLTPATAFMAAYCEILSRWGGGAHFMLNVTLADRLPIHPDIARVIGNFTSVLLLEVDTRDRETFAERALAIQDRLRRDLEYRHFSGLEVARELGRRTGAGTAVRMPYTFNSTLGHAAGDIDGSAIERFGEEIFGVSQTPQVWLNAFLMESRGGIIVQLDAVEELFPPGLLDDMAAAYASLLEQLAADAATWHRASFEILPPQQLERRRLANATAVPVTDELLHSQFLARAAADPSAIALRTSRSSLTYGELEAISRAIAEWLGGRGAQRGELVAIVMRKGWEQIAGAVGVLRAGAAYLPVDPELPPARVAHLLSDGAVRSVLTIAGEREADVLRGIALERMYVDERLRPAARHAPVAVATGDDLAYVLYTSGSTGAPKGVMIGHRGAANVVQDINRRFGIGSRDVFLAVSNFNFDLSVYDIFGALSAGGALAIPEAERSNDPEHWSSLADAHGVTVWNSVPAALRMLLEQHRAAGKDLPRAMRLVLLSGDRIPEELPKQLLALRGSIQVHALGGPTETTVWNIGCPIDAGRDGPIPYGKPLANSRYYILDERLDDCPDWVTGMMYASGVGLAAGYWRDEPRTAASFLPHPRLGERLYRTGDLGRYLPDGNIEILGRSDLQVKLNGYRIETGEIEAHIAREEQIRACAVVCASAGEAKTLVAHLASGAPAEQQAALESALRERLAEFLPAYMIPGRFVWHDSLPLTCNGKVDRLRLSQRLAPEAAAARADDVPAGDIEVRLASLWRELLGRDKVLATQNFFQLGGDSVAAARMAARLKKEFGVDAPLAEVLRHQTVRALGAYVAAGHRVRAERAPDRPSTILRQGDF